MAKLRDYLIPEFIAAALVALFILGLILTPFIEAAIPDKPNLGADRYGSDQQEATPNALF